MNERPTPESDDPINRIDIDCDDSCCTVYTYKDGKEFHGELVSKDFARRLERERNEARELLASEKSTRNAIIAKGIELEHQLAEAREAFVIATDQLVQAQGELRQVREELQRLRKELE
jgi:hypothetical protein